MFLINLKNYFIKLIKRREKRNTIEYWYNRGKMLGARAVLNIQYTENDIFSVTQKQKELIFPFLKNNLTGYEKVILDFGCGIGRFSHSLRDLIKGKVIGIDPVQEFIDLAKKNDSISDFKLFNGCDFPIEDNSIDVFWICLVLGGIQDSNLIKIKNEILRCSKQSSLLVLTENTSTQKDKAYWFYREEKFYSNLFQEFQLQKVSEYEEFGEHISIMIGRISC
jgi:ubiquinone/menaquinone biosynthesis C-methylase UbiE